MMIMFDGENGFLKGGAALLLFFSLSSGCGKSREKAAEKEVKKSSKPVSTEKKYRPIVKIEPKHSAKNPEEVLEKQKLIEIVNRSPKAWKERYMLGGIYLKENDFVSARKQFLEVIKTKPDFVKGYSALAVCSMRMKELDKALEYWKVVRKYEPKNRAARDFIYRIERKRKVDREIAAMVEKVEKRRADWKDKKRLGEKYLELKRFPEAVSMFEQAIKSNPRDPDLYYQLAKAYLNTGQHKKASKFFSRASRMAPGNGQYALMAKRIKQVMANLRKRNKKHRKKKENGSEIGKSKKSIP